MTLLAGNFIVFFGARELVPIRKITKKYVLCLTFHLEVLILILNNHEVTFPEAEVHWMNLRAGNGLIDPFSHWHEPRTD